MTSDNDNQVWVINNQVWVVNTVTLNEGGNADVVAGLQLELVEKVKKASPGFISQHTLVAQDGSTVTTVEVWANFGALKAIAEHPSLIEYRAQIQQQATLSPALYRLSGESHTE